MRTFSLVKNIKKGLEGATIAGASAAGVLGYLETVDVSSENVDKAYAIVVLSFVGYAIRSIINAAKNLR